MKTKIITLYEIDELKDEVKKKVFDKFRDINNDIPKDDDFINEILKENGLKCEPLGYDNSSSYINFRFLEIDDLKILIKKLSFQKFSLLINIYGLNLLHGCMSFNNTHNQWFYDQDLNLYTEQELKEDDLKILNKYLVLFCDKLDKLTTEIKEECLDRLRAYEEYLTSDEAIEDTLKINEYRFLEDGTPFYERKTNKS